LAPITYLTTTMKLIREYGYTRAHVCTQSQRKLQM
jgi:hypothetical protein